MISRRIIQSLVTKKRRQLIKCTFFSTTNTTSSTTSLGGGDKMRIAIVGGGAAGLSSALHLSHLVEQGKIDGPIDIFDPGNSPKREIGVGIWSTALDPFRSTTGRESHKLVIEEMTKRGEYLRDVGYRTPKGHWLAKSRLGGDDMPDLLFLRELDMLDTLRKAIQVEEDRGNVRLHSGTEFKVRSVSEESSFPWSAPLNIGSDVAAASTERDYHLIVAADGMNSTLRQMYGGYVCERSRLTGTTALKGPMDLPDSEDLVSENWHTIGQAVATSTQDRQYTVFRGNAHLTSDEIGLHRSFQTWGEGQSMRFATVPMSYPNSDGTREEREVWFITIDKDEIVAETDPSIRREKLLNEFKDWHEPIRQLVEATPADEILMERAMAHKHSMTPVANFNEIVTRIRGEGPPSTGNGPAIVFIGDAFMCVDPILAQGFTFGMEGASALSSSLETSLNVAEPMAQYPDLAFDPFMLRQELKNRHDSRLQRLICLLRATELVQALGQPNCNTVSGFISRDIIRPLMRVTPAFIKTPIFNAVLKYSLGLPQNFRNMGG